MADQRLESTGGRGGASLRTSPGLRRSAYATPAPAHSRCARARSPGLRSRLRRYSRSAPLQSQSYRNWMSPSAACASALSSPFANAWRISLQRRDPGVVVGQHVGPAKPQVGHRRRGMRGRIPWIDFDRTRERSERAAGRLRAVVREVHPALEIGLLGCRARRTDLAEARRLGARDWSASPRRRAPWRYPPAARRFRRAVVRMTPDHIVAPLPAAIKLRVQPHVSGVRAAANDACLRAPHRRRAASRFPPEADVVCLNGSVDLSVVVRSDWI